MKPLHVLLVEDNPSDEKLVLAELRKLEREIVSMRVEDADAMRAALAKQRWDLVLSDWSLPGFSGLSALRVLGASGHDIPFIIVSGTVGEESAVAAIREGADDYVLKDKLARLVAAVERGLREYDERIARRAAEQRLQAQDVLFRALLERSSDIITLKNAASEFQYVSQAVSTILGYTPAGLMFRSCFDFVHPDDRGEVMRRHAALVAVPGSTDTMEYRVMDSRGAVRWLRGTETNLLDDPSVAGLVGNLHDITDRRDAEDSLRKSEARYRTIVETTNEGVWVLDERERTVFVNTRMAAILGQPPHELVGRSVYDFLEQTRRPVAAQHLAARRAGQPGFAETTLVRADGTRRQVIIESTRILDGDRVGTLGMVTDVTDRREAEAALRASEMRFKQLADSGLVAISYSDLDGKVFDVNDAFAAMLGTTREALLASGASWASLTPVEWRDADRHANEALRTRGVMDPYEKELVRVDGPRVPILIGGGLQDNRCVNFIIDLTAQKRAEAALQVTEQQLRQAQKMEAMGRLAGGVAHDFNNVLSVILSYSEMILAELPPGAPFRDDLEEIRSAGVRAAALTRQLLMFSRQQVVAPTVVDLDAVIANMERMLQRILGEDVELKMRSPSTAARIRIDPGQIEQVILNLAVNARDAMPRGGALTIETQSVELDAQFAGRHLGVTPGRYVMLAVTDTGTGMDAHTLSRIFEPFFTTKEQGKGTGLGLATVFGIVQQAGGTIWVYSEVGLGSTFKVYLPAIAGPVEPVRSAPAADVRGCETILLVEDEPGVRQVAADILRQLGYKVLASTDVDDAEHIARTTPSIDVLLTDVVMPKLGGPALAARIQALHPTIAVLYMSGYTDDSVVRHGVLSADLAFLQKPFTPDSLARKLREVLAARR